MSYSIDHKTKKLPSIFKEFKDVDKSNQIIPTFIQAYLQEHNHKKTLKYHPQKLQSIKAKNFINKSQIIDSPQVISTISDFIKQEVYKTCPNSLHQNAFNDSTFFADKADKAENKKRGSFKMNKQNQNSSYNSNKSKVFQKVSESVYCKKTNISYDRLQLLNLAKWIDAKLQQFNKSKSITISDIVDYKQNILNYGLGKIIESVSKKCKQEGKLLQVLWNNTFKIFENVLTVVSKSTIDKQKQYIHESSQLKQIYEKSLKLQKHQSQQINADMEVLYQKMKRVIIWNKRLRKQKKNLTILNRILEYRNQTYSQALQQTIQMFLKSVPEPSTVNFAKKIIQKLARQKRRKKKTFERNQIENDIQANAKDLVISWLKRNGFVQEEIQQQFHLSKLSNDQKVFLNNVDDQNKIDAVNIYDFFKLLDIGVQATVLTQSQSCQQGDDLQPKTQYGMVTDHRYMKNAQIQINIKQGAEIQAKQNQKVKIMRSKLKKKSSASKISEKSETISIKQKLKDSSKNKQKETDYKGNFIKKSNSKKKENSSYTLKKQDEELKYMKRQKTVQSQQEVNRDKFFSKDFTIISQKKSQEFNFDSEEEIKNSFLNAQNQKYSISKYNAQGTHYYGRQLSIKDFADLGLNFDQQKGINKKVTLKEHWKKFRQSIQKDVNKKDARRSMNFIKIDSNIKSLKKLEKKKFNEVYEQSRQQNIKNRQEMYQTLIRRRSFYKKNKVMFENAIGVQESNQRTKALYKNQSNYRLYMKSQVKKQEFEKNTQESKIDKINQKLAITSNLAKSKTMTSTKAAFRQISDGMKNIKKQPPKNKQFFNASIASINKYIGGLVQDYIRQIKRQKQGFHSDCQKTYYPLYMILMERMNYKYGLKDISEKKLKDFIQKIFTFAPVSQKISLYSLLFGMNGQATGADQLLIYLRSIVYFQKKPNVQNSSMYLFKDPNVTQKNSSDAEIITQNLRKVIEQFFDKKGLQEVQNQVYTYLQNCPNSSLISIEKVSEIIIRSLLSRKKEYHQKCENLYKILIKGDNIFTNIYKMLKMYNTYMSFLNSEQSSNIQSNQSKNKSVSINLKEFLKRSDIIDEIYGKSISFDRFVTACMVTDFPNMGDIQKVILFMNQNFVSYSKINKKAKNLLVLPQDFALFSPQNNQFLLKMCQKWNIKKIQNQNDKQTWNWILSQIISQKVQMSVNSMMGKLNIIGDQIQNFFFSTQN